MSVQIGQQELSQKNMFGKQTFQFALQKQEILQQSAKILLKS